MAIRKFNPATDTIKPGEWVCFESIYLDAICTESFEVTKVSGARVYFHPHEDDKQCTRYKHTSNVKFVCDSKDEGEKLKAISQRQIEDCKKTRKAVLAECKDEIDALIAGVSS